MSHAEDVHPKNPFDLADDLRDSTLALVREARRRAAAPPEHMHATRALLNRLRSQIARDPELSPADVRREMEPARALLEHLRTLTDQEIAAVTERAFEIAPQDLPDALTLLILAAPTSATYWDLARAVSAHLDASIAANTSKDLIHQRWVLRAIVPAGAFRDGPVYPSAPRGGTRADRVEGVFGAGLPSLGKRA